MHFYRIHDCRFHLLDQNDPPDPAVPALLAPAEEAGFQTSGGRRNRPDHGMADHKGSIFSLRPFDSVIARCADLDPNAGKKATDIGSPFSWTS
jgi:hypothetical protein